MPLGKPRKNPRRKAKRRNQNEKAKHQKLCQKENVAIVVEISRPSVQDVVNFLESKQIDANLVVITTIKSHSSKPGQRIE